MVPKVQMASAADLVGATGTEATDGELASYVKKLKDAVDYKYSQLRKAFRNMDKDKSNHLSKDEIITAVQHFALPIPVDHVAEIFDKVLDVDGDGGVSYAEFCEKLKTWEVTH